MRTEHELRDRAATSGGRYLLISADGHVGPPAEVLRTYVEGAHLPAYDEYVAAKEARKAGLLAAFAPPPPSDDDDGGDNPFRDFAAHPSLQPGGHPSLADPARRLEEVEADGVVGEVLFPDFPHIVSNEPPFGTVTGGHVEIEGGLNRRGADRYPADLQWAGARAYNRWLADFCGHAPERFAGIAIVPFLGVEAAVNEIRWARNAGLRGGILLPGMNLEVRYNDPSFEPIWAELEALEMPVNVHSGNEVPEYGLGPDATALQMHENAFFAQRPLWWLLFSGVLERHPNLRVAFTEQGAGWVPHTLGQLDAQYARFGGGLPGLSAPPSEYWARQCYVGAAFMSREETEMRHEIGVANVMWGSDYPHPEGTWPHTRARLHDAYEGIPAHEVALMVGQVAARVYGFDIDTLAPVASRVGPAIEELAGP